MYFSHEARTVDDVVVLPSSEQTAGCFMRAKLFQFHDNYRPAYYGTWRKRSRVIRPRNPLQLDKKLLDYEVDSDEEWEEEEPGESLSHSEVIAYIVALLIFIFMHYVTVMFMFFLVGCPRPQRHPARMVQIYPSCVDVP